MNVNKETLNRFRGKSKLKGGGVKLICHFPPKNREIGKLKGNVGYCHKFTSHGILFTEIATSFRNIVTYAQKYLGIFFSFYKLVNFKKKIR